MRYNDWTHEHQTHGESQWFDIKTGTGKGKKWKIMTNIWVYEMIVQRQNHHILYFFSFSCIESSASRLVKLPLVVRMSIRTHIPFRSECASRRVILSFVRELNVHAFYNTFWNATLINCVCVCVRHTVQAVNKHAGVTFVKQHLVENY